MSFYSKTETHHKMQREMLYNLQTKVYLKGILFVFKQVKLKNFVFESYTSWTNRLYCMSQNDEHYLIQKGI